MGHVEEHQYKTMESRTMKVRPIIIFAAAVLVAVSSRPAEALLRRVPGSYLFGPKPVWTASTTEAFFPLSDPMPSAGLLSVRVSTEIAEKVGNCQVRAGIRYSYDLKTWANAVVIDTTYVSNPATPDFNDDYTDISANARTWIRFGVLASNTVGTDFSACNATLLIEPKEG